MVERLKRLIGNEPFERHLRRAASLAIDGAGVTVTVRSRFAADLIRDRFGDALQTAAQAATGADRPVRFVVEASPGAQSGPALRTTRGKTAAPAGRPPSRQARQRRTGADPRTLEAFIVGRCNRLAYEATRRVAEDDDTGGACPLFLFGPCGVGKSHLLTAAAQRFRERYPGARVRLVSAEAFTNEYIGAVRTGKIEAFHRAHRRTDLLCVDDVHFLSKKVGTQNELLHTFDALDVRGSRVILASDCHPRQIKAFNAGLVSRFISGSMARIDPPDEDTRCRLIAAFAQRAGLAIDPAAVDALASGAEGGSPGEPASVRDLLGLINHARAFLNLNGGAAGSPRVTAAVADAVLRATGSAAVEDEHPTRPVPIERIIRSVCDALAVTPADLAGRGRSKPVVLARAMVSLLARRLTRRSYPEIADALGLPTHSTVIGAFKRITAQIERGDTVDAGLHCDGMPIGLFADRLERELRSA